MKKVFFSVIVLLVLGAAWRLYLEYENRRFIESLPPPPVNVTQPANAPNTLVIEESRENRENIAASTEENELTTTFTESENIHRHPHTDPVDHRDASEMMFESEAVIDERSEHSTEEVPSENSVHAAPRIDEELQQARETLARIGIPIEVSSETGDSLFVVTSAHEKEFLEALSKFPEGAPPEFLLSHPDFRASQRKRMGTRRVKFWGGELEITYTR